MPQLKGYESIKVLGARVVIEPETQTNQTDSGIVIASDNIEPKYQGTVVATGTGARLENGEKMPMEIAPGDKVIYTKMAGVPVKNPNNKDEEFLVINERDVIAIIEE